MIFRNNPVLSRELLVNLRSPRAFALQLAYVIFLGAVVYMVLEDHLSKLSPTFWQFGIGLLLVLAVLFARRGVLGLFEDAGQYWKRFRS